MRDFLLQIKYEPTAFDSMMAKPHSRLEAVKPAIEKLGGKIIGLWFSLGEFDIVGIMTMPDVISIAAAAMRAKSFPAIKEFIITPLLSMEESIEVMKKASTVEITPPSK